MQADGTPFSFSRSEVRALLLILLAGLVGLVVGVRLYRAAFPEASIDFEVSREEAQRLAGVFLRQQGGGAFDPAVYRATTVFRHDDNAKVYLERELGLGQANALMGSGAVAVWRWESRFFRPLQKEEFRVSLSPSGRVIGYRHEVEEKAAGANLDRAEAQPIAENFLSSLGVPLAEYTLIEGTTNKRDNRTDHTFTWERNGFKAKEATYRLSVTVQGDRADGYREFLKVPEAWQRDYQTLRSKNELTQTVAMVLFVALGIALVVVLLTELRRKQVTWRFGLFAGVLVAVTLIGAVLNSLPLTLAGYPTQQPLSSFYAGQVIGAIIGALALAGVIALIGAAGETVYRQGHPGQVAPRKLFSAASLRSKSYFEASVVGYAIPMIMLGYEVVFYLLGRKVGVWAPAGIKHTDAVSTALPWIYPLTVGLQASIFEEFVFRLFAIPFLRRHLKSTFLAVFLPAVVWAFGHSNYPQQPFFIRGVEITVVGVVLGYAFLRYGILSTLIAHYVFNALMVGLFLFRSTSLYFWTSGVIVVGLMLVPFVPSALSLARRRFEASPDILNAAASGAVQAQLEVSPAEAAPVQEAPAEGVAPDVGEAALTPGRVKAILGVAVVSALLLAAVQVERFLDFLRFDVNREEAVGVAEAFLKGRGVETSPFRRVATTSLHTGLDVRYIWRFAGLDTLNDVYQRRLSALSWQVRFFRPLQKEEYTVRVGPDGALQGYTHAVEEKAPGATLSQEEAMVVARESFKKRGVSLDPYKLVEATNHKRDNRMDHVFVWEDSTTKIREGAFRMRVTVQGDEAMGWWVFFKVPEAWEREEMKQTLRQTILGGLLGLLIFGVVVYLVVLFGKQVAGRAIRWRFALTAAAILAALGLVGKLNNLTTFFASYNTTQSLANFLTRAVATNLLLGLAGMFLLSAVLMAFSESLYRTAFPERPSVGDWIRRIRGRGARIVLRDALLLAYAACLASPALGRLRDLVNVLFRVEAGRETGPAPFVTAWLPALDGLRDGLSDALLIPAAFALVAIVALRYLKRPVWMGGSIAVFIILGAGAGAKTWAAFFAGVLGPALSLAVAWIAVAMLYRHNLAAYVLTALLLALTRAGWALATQADGFYRANGVALLALAALPAVWYFTVAGRRTTEARALKPLTE